MKSSVDDFTKIREVNVMRIKEGKENGMKVVGKYCTYFPEELVVAAGAIPVGLCGTKEEPIPVAEEVLPRNLCPLIKSSYGFATSDTCPFFYFSDLVVGETTCDGKKKMFEIMEETKPVHVMQLPYKTEGKESFDLWVREVRALRTRLEEEFDVEITDEAIWKAIDTINIETEAIKSICDLNKMDPPPLSGIDLLTVSWSRGFNIDKVEVIDMLNGFTEAAAASVDVKSKNRPRVLITGCPIGLGSEKVISITEEVGGAVVALENCTGYKTLELQANKEHSDPIVALAEKYLQIPCSCMSPNPYRMELLEKMVEEFKVDAVIDLTWQACHTYNIESYEVEKVIKNKDLPYLHLETDYSNSDTESLKVRIEAMLEMVEK
ncbi:YjiM [Candidatus Syntrophocurvum alkaliphilum]|uniref:YjiM n=1 Tax=Candidatus Syntrophocurvum alkaliphilum TaxID=2293317 RepID=A0A6I6D5G0_9FIRM|nr:double-cubane-cluster-containing anaerobic reductase [Candidatus Syntrophocurvum alkaliphilum]QGT98643.1 YjiM [Candidatus Syntrophocurvum alkaliphilum]